MRSMTKCAMWSCSWGYEGAPRGSGWRSDGGNPHDPWGGAGAGFPGPAAGLPREGEAITDKQGEVAHPVTFRLSGKQGRRSQVPHQIAAHTWHVGDTAATLGIDAAEPMRRVRRLGFEGLPREHGRAPHKGMLGVLC